MSALRIEEDVPLAPFTTLRIGGPARFFATVTTSAELLEAIHFARARALPLFVLGGGSNLLVADTGFPGVVIHTLLTGPSGTGTPAGKDWDTFVRQTCEQGVSGAECLAGIPGLIGGSPIQNIGAYGQEVSATIHTVNALDLESLSFVTLSNRDCGFAYRTSIFNTTHRNRYIVTAIDFRFDPAACPTITYPDLQRHFAGSPDPSPMDVYHAVRAIRAAKGMVLPEPGAPSDPDTRSAGSFFKNPVVPASTVAHIAQMLSLPEIDVPRWPAGEGTVKLPAAWLLERAGFSKGFTLGAAGISSRHTLALINRTGTATCADIVALRDTIFNEVEHRFHIALEQEPIQLGS